MQMRLTGPAFAAAVAVLATAGAAETWQGYTYTTSVIENERLEALARRVTEATNGELTMRFTRGGGLPIGANDVQQAVAEDILQWGDAGGNAVSFVPIFGLSRLPGLYMNAEEFTQAVEVLQPYLDAALEAKGVIHLCSHLYPQQSIFTTFEINSLDDLAGKRVRVGSPQQAAIIEALGGNPVNIATPEVPSALQQNAVDAVLTASAGGGRIWADLLSHNYHIPINWAQALLLVNKARFEALPAETQTLVRDIANEECAAITAGSLGAEDEWVARMGEGGVIFTNPSEADLAKLREMSQPIWLKEVEQIGGDAADALAKVREALEG